MSPISSRLRRFWLEYDAYHKHWEACALLAEDDTQTVLEAYWYKAVGKTALTAIAKLKDNIRKGAHLGKQQRTGLYVGNGEDIVGGPRPKLEEFF